MNKKGYLEDEKGNIIDKFGRKKIEKSHLDRNGELPKLYNYNGRKFEIEEIIGDFIQD